MDIKDKVAIVTGGAHGIGRALCRAFKDEGARGVVIADLDLPASEKLAAELGNAGLAIKCNVANEEEIQNLVAQAREEFGQVDIFVSNAGLGVSDAPGWSATGAPNKSWQLCWDVNVMSQVYAARAVLPEMIERGSGYLLNTASAAGLMMQMGDAAYTATKHASVGFSKSLAVTHGHQGIGVSVLCPQYVATNIIGFEDDSDKPRRPDIIEAEDVAKDCMQAIKDNQFMIQPHKVVKKYEVAMASDYQQWVGGMQYLRHKLTENADELSMELFVKLKPD